MTLCDMYVCVCVCMHTAVYGVGKWKCQNAYTPVNPQTFCKCVLLTYTFRRSTKSSKL